MASKLTSALLTLTFLGVGSLVYFVYKYKNKNEGGKLVKSSNKTSTEILIPKDSIGIIIGRGGNTIKEIELTANVKIHIKESDESNDNFKVCKIEGTPEGVELAEFFIHEVIVNQPLIETYEMVVPSQTCGRIIGKNGSNIRLISRSSNAKIIISSPDSLKPSLDTKIIITGTAEQIEIAKVLVEQKIEEDTQFRKKVATGVSNRAPRNKPKYLLPAKNDMEEVNSAQQKEKFIITSTNNFFEVYVSSVENPDRLWVQMIGSSTVELDRLIEQMTEYYSKIENKKQHKLSEVRCGQIVAAPFAFDHKWYRAEVIEAPNDFDKSDILLYYVDYGDSSRCQKNDLFELRTDFLRLRFQAIECIVAKIKPRGSTWTEEATDLLGDLTHVGLWKPMTAKVHCYKDRPTRVKREGSPIPCVELFESNRNKTINVAEELVEKGLALWEEEESKTKNSVSGIY